VQIAQGAFRASARWIASRFGSHSPGTAFARAQPGAGIDGYGEDPREGGDELSGQLGAIADEVHRHAAAARNGVRTDFAARIAHARKHLSPHLLAAALATFKEQQKVALAAISRNAALELASRRKAMLETFAGRSPRRSRSRASQAASPMMQPPIS
jgi:hypothetical protein